MVYTTCYTMYQSLRDEVLWITALHLHVLIKLWEQKMKIIVDCKGLVFNGFKYSPIHRTPVPIFTQLLSGSAIQAMLFNDDDAVNEAMNDLNNQKVACSVYEFVVR